MIETSIALQPLQPKEMGLSNLMLVYNVIYYELFSPLIPCGPNHNAFYHAKVSILLLIGSFVIVWEMFRKLLISYAAQHSSAHK